MNIEDGKREETWGKLYLAIPIPRGEEGLIVFKRLETSTPPVNKDEVYPANIIGLLVWLF